jgi:hypothetical protein
LAEAVQAEATFMLGPAQVKQEPAQAAATAVSFVMPVVASSWKVPSPQAAHAMSVKTVDCAEKKEPAGQVVLAAASCRRRRRAATLESGEMRCASAGASRRPSVAQAPQRATRSPRDVVRNGANWSERPPRPGSRLPPSPWLLWLPWPS